jgi:hypothetical protein
MCDDDDYNEVCDDEELSFGEYLVLQIVAAPWRLPAMVLQELYPGYRGVVAYPYADESPVDNAQAPGQSTPYTLQLRAGATARNPRLLSGTLAAQIDFAPPVALHIDYRLLTEQDRGVRSWVGLGNAELLYRFAESPRANFHSGLGYLQWADAEGLAHGVGFIYGFDSYPLWPLSFGSRLSIGVLGHSYAFQWRTYLGALIDRYEIQVAYDHLDVAGVQLGGVQLSLQAHL